MNLQRSPAQFPQSLAQGEVLKDLEQKKKADIRFDRGEAFSLVYYLGEEFDHYLKECSNHYFDTNYLNPMAFPSLRAMEKEIIEAALQLFHGPESAVGCLTSGGTESILLAVKTYKNRAKRLKKTARPEMIVPYSAHVAFGKAANYFDVKLVQIPLEQDWRVQLQAYEKAINANTIMLVGSAPQYPHGVMDPLVQLSDLALKYRLPLHVDACLGGWMIPWLNELGVTKHRFDFQLPGVTSISADLHKYGYAPKGVSTLTYSSMEYMKDQFFVFEHWPGGIYAGPTMMGSRPGGPIAAAYGAIKGLGREGYLKLAGQAWEATLKIKQGIEQIAPLAVVGPATPEMTVVTFISTSDRISIFALASQLRAKGWHTDVQQVPNSIHLTVMPNHLPIVERFLSDVALGVKAIEAQPSLNQQGEAATYGLMANLPLRSMVTQQVRQYFMQIYGAQGAAVSTSMENDAESEQQHMPELPWWQKLLLRMLPKR